MGKLFVPVLWSLSVELRQPPGLGVSGEQVTDGLSVAVYTCKRVNV